MVVVTFLAEKTKPLLISFYEVCYLGLAWVSFKRGAFRDSYYHWIAFSDRILR